jgi:hypothetical protein
MRCTCCNEALNDYESTRKDLNGLYIDMCTPCYMTIKDDLIVIERDDLLVSDAIVEETYLDLN